MILALVIPDIGTFSAERFHYWQILELFCDSCFSKKVFLLGSTLSTLEPDAMKKKPEYWYLDPLSGWKKYKREFHVAEGCYFHPKDRPWREWRLAWVNEKYPECAQAALDKFGREPNQVY